MSNMEDKIDENYIKAIMNLYKEVTQEQERMKLKFRTRMLHYIRNDFTNGKITEETFNKAEEELAWAMVNDDIKLGDKEEKIAENPHEVNKDIDEIEKEDSKKINEREAFRKKISVQPKEIEARRQIRGVMQYTKEELEEFKRREFEEWKKKDREFAEKLQTDDLEKIFKDRKKDEETKSNRGER